MREWKPKRKPQLPDPDFHYLEMEAAIHAGIGWDRYKELDYYTQAEIIAHCLEARSREAYEMEKATDDKPDGKGGDVPKMTAEDYANAIAARVVTGQPMKTLAGRHDPPKGIRKP